jgi:hypothetical protein
MTLRAQGSIAFSFVFMRQLGLGICEVKRPLCAETFYVLETIADNRIGCWLKHGGRSPDDTPLVLFCFVAVRERNL